MTTIKPTIGRVVWYYHGHGHQDQAYAALITYVHSDTMINVVAFNANGEALPCTSVTLVQEGEEIPSHHHAIWMPYQLGQAAKAQTATYVGMDPAKPGADRSVAFEVQGGQPVVTKP